MSNIAKAIMTIAITLAVMAYSVWNYVNGKTDLVMFVVCMAIMGMPMLNMIRLLIEEGRKK